MIAWVEQEVEGDLEDLRHLLGIRIDAKRRLHHPDHGRHGEAGPRDVAVEAADHVHVPAGEPDLLLRLPEGRVLGRMVAAFHVTAGEADLTRMMGEMIGPLG